jgi:hypothetical protein
MDAGGANLVGPVFDRLPERPFPESPGKSGSVMVHGILADFSGVILRRTCNGKKALPLLQILFSCLHWLHDFWLESILRPSRVNAVAETVAALTKATAL